MCDPATIMMAVASGAQYMGQASAARRQAAWGQQVYAQEMAFTEEQKKFQLERYIENAGRASEEARQNLSAIDQRINQEAVTAETEIGMIFNNAARETATSYATDAERGVMGPTADVLMDEIQKNALDAVEARRTEQKWMRDAMADMKTEVVAQAQGRIESMNPQPVPLPNLPQPVQKPNALAMMLNIGAMALKSYSNFSDRTTLETTTTGSGGWTGSSYFGRNIYDSSGMSMGSVGAGGWQNYSVRPSWVGG